MKEEEQRALYLSLPALEYIALLSKQGVIRPFVRVKYGQTPSIRRNRRRGSRFRMNGHGYLDQFEPRTPRVVAWAVWWDLSTTAGGILGCPHPNARQVTETLGGTYHEGNEMIFLKDLTRALC